jgi:hypothetical protein
MENAKIAAKRLRLFFYIYAACFLVPLLQIEISGGQSAAWIGILAVSALGYLYFLARLVSYLGKRAPLWVLLAMMTAPFGLFISYPLARAAAIGKDAWK